MDERMNCLWTVRKFAQWKYDTESPSAAKENTVRRLCKEGRLPAIKICNEWRIDVSEIVRKFDDHK